jgi:heat shock protein HslJ
MKIFTTILLTMFIGACVSQDSKTAAVAHDLEQSVERDYNKQKHHEVPVTVLTPDAETIKD